MTALEEIKKAIDFYAEYFEREVLGDLARNAIPALESLQRENEELRHRLKAPEPDLTCPHIDKLVETGELSIEAIHELYHIRDINSMLRYGLWHEKSRAEAAERDRDEWKRLHDAAQRTVADRNSALNAVFAQNEELRKLLQPFAAEAENWHDSVPDDHRTLCTEPNSTTAHPGSEADFTVGDLRRARTALASTGGEHNGN